MKIHFRLLAKTDFRQMHTWLNTDHVKQFWKKPAGLEDIKRHYEPYITGEKPTAAYMIMMEDVEVGYIQTYYYSDYPGEYYESLEADKYSAGVDLFIGHKDYIHKGHGVNIIKTFISEYVFTNPKTLNVIITPEPGNSVAIKVYEKAGFKWYKTINIPDDGEVEYLMVLTREKLHASYTG